MNDLEPGTCDNCFYRTSESMEECNTCVRKNNWRQEEIFTGLVNHPKHYTFGSMECIDLIKELLTPNQFEGFCLGNSIKYLFRHNKKNGLEDIKKAKWYIDKTIDGRDAK